MARGNIIATLMAFLLSGVVVADEIAVPDWIKQARAERPAIKKKYGALYDEVSAILYRHDPIGLAPLAPSDEYDPEVGTILPRLQECRSEQEVQTVLFEEFVRWFGADNAGAREAYAGPSREIWQAWLRFQ